MARYFLDTSVLVKLYHDEVGSDRLDELLDPDDRLVVSALGQIEFLSAIFRKVRTGELKAETAEKVVSSFLLDWRLFEVIPVSDEVLEKSCMLIKDYGITPGLRTLDSVQLASAMVATIADALDYFICADTRLCDVAHREHLKVSDPCRLTPMGF